VVSGESPEGVRDRTDGAPAAPSSPEAGPEGGADLPAVAAEGGDAASLAPAKRRAARKVETADAHTGDAGLPTAASIGEPDEAQLHWYVIRVQSGREDTLSSKIQRKLQLAGLDRFVRSIVVPKQKVGEIKEGKKRVREMKLYPGYFFMEMQLVEEIWYLLRDTAGVGDFVGGGQKPIPMTAKEVRKLLDVLEERERDEAPEIKIEVQKGDTVKIKEGPFENFEGVVEEVQPQKGLIRVMVTIFGRETPVDLEYWQVEKV
jgi:transcriptional antiterminator NusG